MTILLVMFIPTFLALILAIVYLFKTKEYNAALLLFLTNATIIFHFYHYTQYWAFNEHHAQLFVYFSNIVSCSIFPFIYLYLSNRIGIKLYDKYFILLSAIILFNFIGKQTIVLDNTPIAEVPKYNFDILVYYGGKIFIQTWMHQVIMSAQAIIFAYKIITIKRKMNKELLHVNPKSRLFIVLLLTSCVLTIVELNIPSSLKEKDGVIYAFTSLIIILTTTVLILIQFGYQIKPLINKRGQPVLLQVKPKLDILEDKFKNVIENENLFTNPDLRIEDVANKIDSNTDYVRKMLKNQIGISFTEYINFLRIEKAKKLIMVNNIISLEEVAHECGFKTTLAFTKTFKDCEGYTPSAWIKIVRKN